MKWVSIQEVAEVNPKVPKSVSEQTSASVTFLPMAAVSEEGTIDVPEEAELGDVIKGYRYFEEGDALLAKITPCMENGKATFVEGVPHKIGFGSTEFHVLRPNVDIFGRYLFYMVWNPAFRHTAGLNMTGTAGQRRVPTDFVKRYRIPLPPLAEQRRIAAILDKADAIRRKRKQAIQYTDELLRAAFIDMFGDPENSSYPVKTLDEVCLKITDGAHFTPTYVDRGVPFLRVTDIQGERIDWENVKYIPVEEHEELIKRCHPQKGDVLYSKNGTIGIPRIIDWDKEFSIFVSLALLKPNKKLMLSEYLESFLKTPFALRQALSHTKTGTVSNLHLVEIRKVKLPIPEMRIQEEWISVKSEIEKSSKKIIRLAEESDDLFNSLLQRAFRGELSA